MNFPFKDLSNQQISQSYDGLLQKYNQYVLDALGNVVFEIGVSGSSDPMVLVQSSQTASMVVGTASYATTAVMSVSSSHAIFAEISDTASLAIIANVAIDAIHAETASYVLNAVSASYAENVEGILSSLLAGKYKFSTATSESDPGAGKLKYNSTVSGSITKIFLSETTDPGFNSQNLLGSLLVGDQLYIQENTDSTVWMRVYVTGLPTDNGSWWTVPTTFMAGGSGGLPQNNKSITVIFFLANSPTNYTGSFLGNLTGTASYATTAGTASYLAGSIESASFALTASHVEGYVAKIGDTMTGDLIGTDFVKTRSGTITRDVNGLVSAVALTGGRTMNITRTGNYISSITDGIRTWTYSRDANNQIISWGVT